MRQRWPARRRGPGLWWQSWCRSSSGSLGTLAPLLCKVSGSSVGVCESWLCAGLPSVAVLTFKIKHLTEHVKRNTKVRAARSSVCA